MSDLRARHLQQAIDAAERAVIHDRNLLILSPPGISPTMIARRIPTIMPPLEGFWLERVRATYDIAGLRYVDASGSTDANPPFRAPHHTISPAALAGRLARVGELQLARYGVLYLDDLPEFSLAAIEALSARLGDELVRPRVLIVASAAPCPCGWRGSEGRWAKPCGCPEGARERYLRRLRDYARRLNLTENVTLHRPLQISDLRDLEPAETSAEIRARVCQARRQR